MPKKSPGRARIFGNFELQNRIGKGAVGQVFKARNINTGAIVAIKMAPSVVVDDPQLRKRFEREYTAIYHLTHPNLVKILDYNEHRGIPFLVMEFIDGGNLAEYLEKHESLGEHEALSIILPVADALTYLHNQQIIHRDVKPANILISADGGVKLADLGLIKDLDSLSRVTATKMGLGSLQFASPEQFDNASKADLRSDIYSLAATLYMALTGDLPFGKGTTSSLMMRKFTNQFVAPIDKVPGMRPELDAAIRMALHADAISRPASMADFVAYLTGWKKYDADVVLPGKTTTSLRAMKPVKPVELPTDERRAHPRFELHVTGSCRVPIDIRSKAWGSAIMDISKTGIGLNIQRRFEVGTILEIMFAVRPNEDATTHLARVRWNKPAPGNTWSHGCAFVNAMSQEDFKLIFDPAPDAANAG